jgi:hypothetical protein
MLFRYDAWVKAANGPAVAGAQVYVLGQPANLNSSPSPLLSVFADVNGLLPLSQPLVTDGFGHVDFYISGGPFTVGSYFNGVLQNSYADQYPMGASVSTAILLETNGTTNPVQNVLNLVAGSNVTLASDNSGDVTISSALGTSILLQTNGTSNVSQTKLNLVAGTNISLASDGSGDVTITNSLSPLTLQTNGTNNTSQAKLNLVAGTNVTLSSDGSGDVTINSSASSGLPSSPQIGDTIRYNVYGNSVWNATQQAFRGSVSYFYDPLGGGHYVFGATETTILLTATGSTAIVFPNATDIAGLTYTSAATSSASTVIGASLGTGANYGQWSFGSIYRWSIKFAAAASVTNTRYWMGTTVYNTGGSGGETSISGGTTSFASNNPNRSMIGFRYSNGTDAHWVAVTQVTGGAQTIVDTGVSVDANSHLFEYAYNGGAVGFYIDGSLVATINTNVPTAATFRVYMFWCGDNEATNTAVSGTDYGMAISTK